MQKYNQHRRTFDDCVWTDTGKPFEKQTAEDPQAAKEALIKAMQRHEQRMKEKEYSHKHHGGTE